MTVIESGHGIGYEAKVSSVGRLFTNSTTQALEHDASLAGDAYFANISQTAETLTVTTTGGPVLYMKNTSTTKNLVLSKVLVSTDQAATTLKIVRGPTLGTIGNENTHTPVNANVGSTRTASITCYNWDEVGNGLTGLTGGDTFNVYLLGVGSTLLPIDDSIILPPGTAVSLELQATGSTSECALGVRFFYEEF